MSHWLISHWSGMMKQGRMIERGLFGDGGLGDFPVAVGFFEGELGFDAVV